MSGFHIQYASLQGKLVWSPTGPRLTLEKALHDARLASVGWRILNDEGEVLREWFDYRYELPALHGPYTESKP